ncbi:MAG TPA: hypothetical protein VN729_00815 [Ktedonobacteraceae bacterium]|nr:hypothetical protein [Ktedonobacteraceae bacterium]
MIGLDLIASDPGQSCNALCVNVAALLARAVGTGWDWPIPSRPHGAGKQRRYIHTER